MAGTSYDLMLRRRYKRKLSMKTYAKDLNSESSSGLGCTTYDLTQAIPNKSKNNCAVIAIPSGVNNNNSDENLAIDPSSLEDEKLSKFKLANINKYVCIIN